MAQPSAFAKKLARTAIDLHSRFHMMDEGEPALSREIKKFWTDTGQAFPGVETPWSAVFVSACVKRAGATNQEFFFNPAHSQFVHRAIQNGVQGVGVFRGVEIATAPVGVGDIIQNNRGGTVFDFAHAAANRSYKSHSAIVVETGIDSDGNFALTIGGNEGDSIRRTVVRLNAQGIIKQRPHNPFICLVKNLK